MSTTTKPFEKKLERLHQIKVVMGTLLHERLTLAHEIFNDTDYHQYIMHQLGLTPADLCDDTLAKCLDNTWPDLITQRYNWNGSNGFGSLKRLIETYPHQQDWKDKTLDDLWKQLTKGLKRTRPIIHRNRATLKQLQERDDEIHRLKNIINALKQQITTNTQTLQDENEAIKDLLKQIKDELTAIIESMRATAQPPATPITIKERIQKLLDLLNLYTPGI